MADDWPWPVMECTLHMECIHTLEPRGLLHMRGHYNGIFYACFPKNYQIR